MAEDTGEVLRRSLDAVDRHRDDQADSARTIELASRRA
jgi:hypothetical protein